MPTTYVRKDNPNEVLGTFTDEELAMKMPTEQGYGGTTETQRLESLGYVPQSVSSSLGGEGKLNSVSQNLSAAGIASSSLPQMQSYADLVSDEEESNLKEAENQRLERMRSLIGEEYETAIAERRQRGEKQIGGAEAQFGVSRGLGASSSRMQFLQDMNNQIQGDIDTLTKQKANAVAKLEFESADRITEQIQKLEETRYKVQNEAYNRGLQLLQEERAQAGEQREQEKYEFDLQNDKADELVSGLVDVDETGKIVEPTPEELKQYAEDKGIDLDILASSVNERIDALKKVERENRGKTSYYDEKGAGNTTIRHYFNELTGEELYKKNLGQTYKPTGGGGEMTTEEKKFQSDLSKKIEELSKGGDWGEAYNFMAVNYGRNNPDLTRQLTDEEKQQLGAIEGQETYLDILLGKNYFT